MIPPPLPTTPLPSPVDLEMIETIVSMAGLKFPLCTPDLEDNKIMMRIEMKSHDTKAATSAFQNTMEFWMKQNWCNPFPDDEVLHRLSHHLLANDMVPWTSKDLVGLRGIEPSEYDRIVVDITTEKINTWLVNTRTRKWRPAIEKAFDLRRPVSLLTEDSIRLYEGKEVRPLEGWNSDSLFSFDQKFTTELKMWKKKGYTGRTTKNKRTTKVKATKRRHVSLETPYKPSDEEGIERDDDYDVEGTVGDIEEVEDDYKGTVEAV